MNPHGCILPGLSFYSISPCKTVQTRLNHQLHFCQPGFPSSFWKYTCFRVAYMTQRVRTRKPVLCLWHLEICIDCRIMKDEWLLSYLPLWHYEQIKQKMYVYTYAQEKQKMLSIKLCVFLEMLILREIQTSFSLSSSKNLQLFPFSFPFPFWVISHFYSCSTPWLHKLGIEITNIP